MTNQVSLQEITEDTVLAVCRLSNSLSEQHQQMVAPNAVSLAQALFSETAWYRAIYLNGTPIGFMMTNSETEDGVTEVFLWRFMIAAPYQNQGYGRQALQILIDTLRAEGHTQLVTSCGEGEGSPKGFYEKLGFVPNGSRIDDEVVMVLSF